MRRHNIVQTISKLPFEDCLSEVHRMEAFEKKRHALMNEIKDDVPIPVLKSVMEAIQRKRQEGVSLRKLGAAEADELIKRYCFDQIHFGEEEHWELQKHFECQKEPSENENAEDHDCQESDDEAGGTGDPVDDIIKKYGLDEWSPEQEIMEELLDDWSRRQPSPDGSDSSECDPAERPGTSLSRAPWTRNWTFKTAPQPKELVQIEGKLEEESKGRSFQYLLKLDMPSSAEGQNVVRNVAKSLQQGLRDCNKSGTASNSQETTESVASLSDLARELSRVYRQDTHTERDIEHAFASLVNGVAAHINKEPLQEHALFLCVSRKTLNISNPRIAQYHDGTDEPDIVSLDEPVDCDVKDQESYEALRTWGVVKRRGWQDLDALTFRQHSRYAYRMLLANRICGRQVAFTLCGQMLRLWVFDASGCGFTRAINITDDSDTTMLELAQALVFLTGPSEGLQQRWTPGPDETFYVNTPAPTSSADGDASNPESPKDEPEAELRLQVQGSFRFLSDRSVSGLWGQRTCVFGGAKAIRTPGRRIGGEWVPEEGSSSEMDLVLRLSWVPEDALHHEHQVLRHLESQGVKNIPRSHGHLRLSGDWTTFLSDKNSLDHLNSSLDAHAPRLRLSAMALETPTGLAIDYSLPFHFHVRLFRHLVALLHRLAKCDVHCRDLNPANFRLHPDWEQMLEKDPNDARILLLIDFGNARIGRQIRAPSNASGASFGPAAKAGWVESADLSLEDALSSRGRFTTCKAIRRLEREKSLQSLNQRYQKALFQPELYDLGDAIESELRDGLFEQISKLEHRYPDDIEVAFYCFLEQVLLYVRASPDFSFGVERKLQDKVVDEILDERKTIGWTTTVRQGRQNIWPDLLHLKGKLRDLVDCITAFKAPIAGSFYVALTSICATVNKVQAAAKDQAERPVHLMAEEDEAFRETLKTLDTFIESLSPLPESGPGQDLGKRASAEDTASAAKRERTA